MWDGEGYRGDHSGGRVPDHGHLAPGLPPPRRLQAAAPGRQGQRPQGPDPRRRVRRNGPQNGKLEEIPYFYPAIVFEFVSLFLAATLAAQLPVLLSVQNCGMPFFIFQTGGTSA